MGQIILFQTLLNCRYYLLLLSVLLVPITLFLGKSSRVSFFPSYLIFFSFLLLIGSAQVKLLFLANKRTIALLIALLSYLALSSLWVESPTKSSAIYFSYELLILTFVLSFSLLEQKFSRFFELFLLVTAASACISVCYSVYLFHALDYQPLIEPRLYALGGLHNPVVSALSYGAALCLSLSYFAINKDPGRKIISAAFILTLLIGLSYTGTRSAWIGLLAACSILIIILPDMTSVKKRVIAMFAFACLVIAALLLWLLDYHSEILKRSTSFRFEIWSSVIDKILSGPLIFGYGHGIDDTVDYKDYLFQHPHSIYLATLFYGGVVGLSLFLALVGHFYFRVLHNNLMPYSLYAVTGLTFGLISLIFDGNKLLAKIDFLWLLIWLPFAFMIMQNTRLALEKTKDKSTKSSTDNPDDTF